MYIFSLAIADFLVGSVVDTFGLAYTVYGKWPIEGPIGTVSCYFWLVCDFVNSSASTYHLIVIAHERYQAITNPLQVHTSSKNVKSALAKIVVVWFLALASWTPMFVLYHDTILADGSSCIILPPDAIFTLIQNIIVYNIPQTLLFYFIVRIIYTLYRKRSFNLDKAEVESTASTSTSSSTVGLDKPDAKTAGSRAKFERATRTMIVVIVVFFICWVPFALAMPINAMCSCIPYRIYEVTWVLAYMNSAINPCIYFIFNSDFRHALRQLFHCKKQ